MVFGSGKQLMLQDAAMFRIVSLHKVSAEIAVYLKQQCRAGNSLQCLFPLSSELKATRAHKLASQRLIESMLRASWCQVGIDTEALHCLHHSLLPNKQPWARAALLVFARSTERELC